MRVAAICDIRGSLPTLETVLQEIREAGVDRLVVGGDVVPGPLPRETLTGIARLRCSNKWRADTPQVPEQQRSIFAGPQSNLLNRGSCPLAGLKQFGSKFEA
jgi:hypothetical protein